MSMIFESFPKNPETVLINAADAFADDQASGHGNVPEMGLLGVFDGVQQQRQLIIRKTDIQNRTHNLDHGSFVIGHWGFNSLYEFFIKQLWLFYSDAS